MAELDVGSQSVTVRLNLAESLIAWRRTVEVPVKSLRMVQVEESPLDGLPLVCLPGLSVPRALLVGTYRRAGRREFAAVHAHRPAVVLELEGEAWDRVIVSVPRAAEVAAELAGLLLGRAPASPRRQGGFPTGAQD